MREVIFLNREVENFFSSGDVFDQVKNINGTVYRDFANRTTKEFKIGDQSYFIKVHLGVGWYEILKNYSQFKRPTTSAYDEWMALNRLKELGIKCPEPVAFGREGSNSSSIESFIITKSLLNTVSLEDFSVNWKKNPPSKHTKDAILNNVAKLCRKLHGNGMNHRDLYLCHFHISIDSPLEDIYLIDLHRAQIRDKLPNRWRAKDIGGLLHSAIDIGFSERHFYKFFMIYFNCTLKDVFLYHANFIDDASKRAFRMFLKPKIDSDLQRLLNYFRGRKELLSLLRNIINKDIKYK